MPSAARTDRPRLEFCFVQLALAGYRSDFLRLLAEDITGPAITYTGESHFKGGFVAASHLPGPIRRTTNRYFLRRMFVVQPSSIRDAILADQCVMEGNPRFVNTWIVASARRLRGRRTVWWGHVDGLSGDTAMRYMRQLQRRLCGIVLLYTDEEADRYAAGHPRRRGHTHVAPNALYTRASWSPPEVPDPAARPYFLLVGRLAEEKKPWMAVQAFLDDAELRERADLVVVGDGPLRGQLDDMISAAGGCPAIRLLGAETDQERLRPLFTGAAAAISCDYVGLLLTQATFFGCPVVLPANAIHAPENTLADPELNCLHTEVGSVPSLAEALRTVLDWPTPPERRQAIARNSIERFSVEAMVAGFVGAARASGRRSRSAVRSAVATRRSAGAVAVGDGTERA